MPVGSSPPSVIFPHSYWFLRLYCSIKANSSLSNPISYLLPITGQYNIYRASALWLMGNHHPSPLIFAHHNIQLLQALA